jgi:hypothetical protein
MVVVGTALGLYLFGSVVTQGVSSEYFSGNLLYDLNFIPFYEINKYLYLLVTSVPFIIASDRLLKLFGVLAILSFGLSDLFYKVTFVSVWCFFAAVLQHIPRKRGTLSPVYPARNETLFHRLSRKSS